MKTKILLVEDDQNFGDVLKSYLEMHDFDVTLAVDGQAGMERFRKSNFDLCILDVMMPKKDGFTLGREIREKDKQIPIVFLTAKAFKDDVLTGFKAGADDYITKPFNSEELLARIHAILNRTKPKEEPDDGVRDYYIGKYHFNYPLRILTFNESKDEADRYKLSPKEALLLRMFCRKLNDVVPRSEALMRIWGQDDYFTARSMDVFITKLRKYLSKDSQIEIVNIHGNGFQLHVRAEESI